MFTKGIRLVAGILVVAIVLTTIPKDTFTATVEDSYVWDTAGVFTAGAHRAIEDTVVLNDTEMDYIVSTVIKGEAPLVAEPEQEKIENFYADKAVLAVDGYVNIRALAIDNSKVLGKLYANDVATVLGTLDGWYKVTAGAVTGYIHADDLIVGDEDACKAAEEARRKAEEEARRKAEEEARKKAEEEARIEANRKQQYINAANKTYYPPSGTGGQAVVDYAMQFVGNPYVLGGSSLTNGIDCSNFIMRIYEAFGVTLPHNSYALRTVGYEVSASEIKPGDIICYQGHVSIYAGDGKCVHASNRKDGIKVSQKWNYTRVITIRRIFDN